MTPEPIGLAAELLAGASAGLELAVLSLAAYLALTQKDRTPAEAAACALLLPLLLLSAVFQAAFIAGRPAAALPVEILMLALSAGAIYQYRAGLPPLFAHFRSGIGGHPFLAAGTGIVFGYLLVQAMTVPPGPIHWIDLTPMAYLEGRGGFFTRMPAGCSHATDMLSGSVNQPILFHLLLRTGTDRGLGLLGFTAYLSIGFSTYALARRYAWPPTALTAALVVLSLPRLVVQATGPGIELMAAAAALTFIVCLYRLLEQPNSVDLLLMGLFLTFSISGRQMSLSFPLVLAVLSVVLLYRRHGGRIWRKLLSERPLLTLAAFCPAVLISQLWLPIARLASGNGATVMAGGQTPNAGGLGGALANLVRYGLESVHLTLPVEHASRWLFSLSPMRLLEGIYSSGAGPFLGQQGAAAPFAIRWLPDETYAWFGPFGFLLVVPAVVYALWRGPRRIKAVALALVVYGYLAALIPAWYPGNARLFTPVFVCGGFCVAFFLPPWRLTTIGKYLLQSLSLALLLYAGAMNSDKPVVGYAAWIEDLYAGDPYLASGPLLRRTRGSIWKRVAENRWQITESRDLFGDDRIQRITELIGPDQPVGVFAARPERAYPLLRGKGCRVVPLDPAVSAAALRDLRIEYLLYLDLAPAATRLEPGMRKIWSSDQQGALPGALFELNAGSSIQALGGGPSSGPGPRS